MPDSFPVSRRIEKSIAVASFIAAVILAFLSVFITSDHDVPNGTLMMCAQFLTLTATILGIDYKFTSPRHSDHDRNQ